MIEWLKTAGKSIGEGFSSAGSVVSSAAGTAGGWVANTAAPATWDFVQGSTVGLAAGVSQNIANSAISATNTIFRTEISSVEYPKDSYMGQQREAFIHGVQTAGNAAVFTGKHTAGYVGMWIDQPGRSAAQLGQGVVDVGTSFTGGALDLARGAYNGVTGTIPAIANLGIDNPDNKWQNHIAIKNDSGRFFTYSKRFMDSTQIHNGLELLPENIRSSDAYKSIHGAFTPTEDYLKDEKGNLLKDENGELVRNPYATYEKITKFAPRGVAEVASLMLITGGTGGAAYLAARVGHNAVRIKNVGGVMRAGVADFGEGFRKYSANKWVNPFVDFNKFSASFLVGGAALSTGMKVNADNKEAKELFEGGEQKVQAMTEEQGNDLDKFMDEMDPSSAETGATDPTEEKQRRLSEENVFTNAAQGQLNTNTHHPTPQVGSAGHDFNFSAPELPYIIPGVNDIKTLNPPTDSANKLDVQKPQ